MQAGTAQSSGRQLRAGAVDQSCTLSTDLGGLVERAVLRRKAMFFEAGSSKKKLRIRWCKVQQQCQSSEGEAAGQGGAVGSSQMPWHLFFEYFFHLGLKGSQNERKGRRFWCLPSLIQTLSDGVEWSQKGSQQS